MTAKKKKKAQKTTRGTADNGQLVDALISARDALSRAISLVESEAGLNSETTDSREWGAATNIDRGDEPQSGEAAAANLDDSINNAVEQAGAELGKAGVIMLMDKVSGKKKKKAKGSGG